GTLCSPTSRRSACPETTLPASVCSASPSSVTRRVVERPRMIILVSNDIVPGQGLPVAAPGLRVHGLAAGLAAHGYPVRVVVVRGPLDRQWRAQVPPPLARDTVALNSHHLGSYL